MIFVTIKCLSSQKNSPYIALPSLVGIIIITSLMLSGNEITKFLFKLTSTRHGTTKQSNRISRCSNISSMYSVLNTLAKFRINPQRESTFLPPNSHACSLTNCFIQSQTFFNICLHSFREQSNEIPCISKETTFSGSPFVINICNAFPSNG